MQFLVVRDFCCLSLTFLDTKMMHSSYLFKEQDTLGDYLCDILLQETLSVQIWGQRKSEGSELVQHLHSDIFVLSLLFAAPGSLCEPGFFLCLPASCHSLRFCLSRTFLLV